MKPQAKEFWIIEWAGKVTVGHCYSAGATTDLWELIGKDLLIDSTREGFRAVRKIDVGALLDGDPVTITSLSRLLLGVIVEAGSPLRPPRSGQGAHVRISKSTQVDLNPGEWRTVVTSDHAGDVIVEAIRIAETVPTKSKGP
jgi:hypothetical protein